MTRLLIVAVVMGLSFGSFALERDRPQSIDLTAPSSATIHAGVETKVTCAGSSTVVSYCGCTTYGGNSWSVVKYMAVGTTTSYVFIAERAFKAYEDCFEALKNHPSCVEKVVAK